MSWYEIILRIAIVLFGILALLNSILIGYELCKKVEDED